MFVKIEVEECAECTGRGRDPCPILGCSQCWLHVGRTREAVKLRTPRPPPPREAVRWSGSRPGQVL